MSQTRLLKGLSRMQEYNGVLIKSEKQTRFILRVVAEHPGTLRLIKLTLLINNQYTFLVWYFIYKRKHLLSNSEWKDKRKTKER